jgi:hypothetical protein
MVTKAVIPLALLFTLTACIEFERQTVTYEHDPKADTLRIYQTYHGIYGSTDVTALSEEERAELHSVMTEQRTFFFANWAWELDVESMKGDLALEATPTTNSIEEAARRAESHLLMLVVANVRVENGTFYLNEQGQLCGTQRVTIRNVSTLLAAWNAALRRAWELETQKAPSAPGGFIDVTAETAKRELKMAALARPGPFIALTGQQVRVRIPMSREEFDSPDEVDFFAEFVNAGGAAWHQDGEMHVRFGRTDAARESTTLPFMDKDARYRPNAIGHVRDSYGIAKDFDPRKDSEEFLRAKPAKVKR